MDAKATAEPAVRPPAAARLGRPFTRDSARIAALKRWHPELCPPDAPQTVRALARTGFGFDDNSEAGGVSRDIRNRLADVLDEITAGLRIDRPTTAKELQTIASTAALVFGWRDRDRAPAVRLFIGKVAMATDCERPPATPQPVLSCGAPTTPAVAG